MSTEFIKLVSDLQFERFNMHLAQLAGNRTPVAIFFGFELKPNGAVNNIQALVKTGLNVNCIIVLADRQAEVLRNFVDVPVVALEDISHFGEENFPVKPQEVFFVEVFKDVAFADYFTRYGIEVVAPIYVDDQPKYFSLIMQHLHELYAVHEMFIDDESRNVFRAVIKGRLTGKVSDYRFASEPQYFLDGFTPSAGDIAIDGGAFDGATAESFAKCGAKVFAFEMDANNYQRCLARVGQKPNITLENLGLSDRESEENYLPFGTASQKDPEGNRIGKFIDLDTYVARKNLPRVDYIKLDIEGSELDMLHGATKTIARCKPKMAVSVYHKWEDPWTLAAYIKSLRPDYEFAFRHHKIDGKDYFFDNDQCAILKYFGLSWLVPTPCEFVLYCR
ncbi:MAG: FkbM family methyltransferase [Selenomonadaceae bacterium]|nr:FkbM family methyltransferase [Selenomonadaceae bacterium]